LDRGHVPNGVSVPALFVLLDAASEQRRSEITQLLQNISGNGFDDANTLPSLVAGDSLYLLDSTYRWTSDESPKFIMYNFIKKRGDRRAQHLLDYYSALPHTFTATYSGCAFRIPLDKGRIASVD